MREDIRERIEMIKRGEVPEGYKRTKLGIIPDDWDVIQIKDCLKRVDNPVSVESEKRYKQIGIRSHGKGLFYKEEVTGRELGNKKVFWIEPNCFVVNIVFAWEQAVGKTTENEVGMIASHRFPMYRPIDNKVSVDYLVQYFLTAKGKEIMEHASPGGAGRNRTLGQDRFMKSYIVSPSYKEQNNIAEIMNKFEKLILEKEKYIEEKKSQKKWIMQSLLKRERYLSGVSSEWKKVRLSDLLNEEEERNKNKSIIDVKSVSNKQGFINQNQQFGKSVASNDLSTYKIVRKNKIAYNPSRINVGSIALYEEDSVGVISPMYVVFSAKENLDNSFFMQYVKSNRFKNKVKSRLSGSVRSSLKFGDLCSISIEIPDINEQRAIAQVLTTADREIELLEKQLEQIKLEKKAMMQLLLTGIVRVDKD